MAHPPVAVADTAAADTAAAALADARPAATSPAAPGEDLSDVRPATPQFLALFADTAAGPFRFAQRPRAAAQTLRRSDTAAMLALPGTPSDSVDPEPDPPRRRRQPLGTPIDPPR
jgi:hypothetical protein